ncbi:MAG: 16S rRNA (adenine(1518)-N(6)/adenine(1519)-N(6))-dimethyltransferase RsmA [bacterium]
MYTKDQIKTLCAKYDLMPSKSKGQNFLTDFKVIEKIIEVAKISKQETILEIGPGLGVLTGELIKSAKKVIAVELDKKLFDFLQVEFVGIENLELINSDILKLNLAKLNLKDFEYRLIANLPYNITSVAIRNFLTNSPKPSEMILMVQKEVAQRICAPIGEMSILGISAQFYGLPEVLFEVRRGCFWPEPKVDSAVIKIKLKENLPEISEKKFFQIVKMGFSSRRKQLHNNLASGLNLKSEDLKKIIMDLGFDEKIRAQDLGVADWIKIQQMISK